MSRIVSRYSVPAQTPTKVVSRYSEAVSTSGGVKIVSRYSLAAEARPGTKIVSRYSAAVEAALAANVRMFRVFRGYEGKQIVINWGLDVVTVKEVRLIRKLDSWPENVEDGVMLVQDFFPWTKNSYSDYADLEIYRVYYYQLFMLREDGIWFWDRRLRGKIFALPTGYFEDRLWRSMPNVYQRVDGEA